MYRTAQLNGLIILLLTFLLSSHGIAQTTESTLTPSADDSDSIARLATAVENLTRLLENQAVGNHQVAELRKLDIAISYLNFRSRRIELLERDLAMLRNERGRIESAMQQWRERQDLLSAQMEEMASEEKEPFERERQELLTREKTFAKRFTSLEEEIIIQENRIAELHSELDSVESYVQEHLKM